MKKFRERVEKHAVIWFVGSMLAAFLAGIGAFKQFIEYSGRTYISTEHLKIMEKDNNELSLSNKALNSELTEKDKLNKKLQSQNRFLSQQVKENLELQMKLEKKNKQIKQIKRETEISNNKTYNRTLSEREITSITGDATWSEDGEFSMLLHNGNTEIQLKSIVFEVSQKQEDGSVIRKQYSKQFSSPVQPLATTRFVVEIPGKHCYLVPNYYAYMGTGEQKHPTVCQDWTWKIENATGYVLNK